jgi:hypothetical protein
MCSHDEEDSPGEWRRLVVGGLLAAFMGYIACDAFTSGEATYSYRGYPKPGPILFDDGAFAFGLQAMFVASFLHFHYFWTYFPRFQRLRSLVTYISLAGFVVTTVYSST